MLVSGFGQHLRIDLREGETLRVDPEHLLAWSAGMACKVVKASRFGIGVSVLSGELTALKFYGPGTVHMSSHKIGAFANQLPARASVKLSSGGSSSSSQKSSKD